MMKVIEEDIGEVWAIGKNEALMGKSGCVWIYS